MAASTKASSHRVDTQTPLKLALFILTAAVIAGGLMDGSGRTAAQVTTAPTTAPANGLNSPTGFGPLSYFQDNCARCHGDYGSAYGEGFGKHLADAQLEKVIDDMAFGPGNAPLQPRELAVQVAYHKAMIAGQPFATVTKITIDGANAILEGEAPPDTAITVTGIPATMEGHSWRATVPVARSYPIKATVAGAAASIVVTP
jgi:hypothetical protein